jgi:hypothetical protein
VCAASLSQADEAEAIVEDLRHKLGKLREGHLLTLSPLKPKNRPEEEDEEEDNGEEEEEDGAGAEARRRRGEGEGETTLDNYSHRRLAARRAKAQGLVGSELNLHTLATLMKETNRKVRAGLAVDRLKENLDRFLREGLINVHSRCARTSSSPLVACGEHLTHQPHTARASSDPPCCTTAAATITPGTLVTTHQTSGRRT